jgi:hypothetical protein
MAYRLCGAPRYGAASLIAAVLHVAFSATAHASPVDTSEEGSNGQAAQPVSPASERPAPGEVGGLFGPVRIGAFGGVGFPRPLSVEGMVKFADVVGLGLEYGALPDITVSGVTASLSAIDVDLRVFPWRGGFFVGVAMGRQELGATATSVLPMGLGSLTERVSADTWLVNPRIGFLWTWPWGLTVGMDLGAQIPVSSSYTNTIPPQFAVSRTATNAAHLLGGDVLPTVNVLRLGLLL